MPADDWLIFSPGDVDLSRSPLRAGIDVETYVLGAFNPALTRLPNGNLLLMVRVAEALKEPVRDGHVHQIRWTPGGYVLDAFALGTVDMTDPRAFVLKDLPGRPFGLTSLSWLLPVEIAADAQSVVAVHYDRAIAPTASHQQYGIEDPRISLIGASWYMTSCAVSAERHSTTLHVSLNGLDYRPMGIILDHQNKDMALFEGRVGNRFTALTRPLGDSWLTYPPDSEYRAGPSINLAQSPDALHWKPLDAPGIRSRTRSRCAVRIGSGAPPILTPGGWLVLYHGVEPDESIGTYRTYWAMLDRDDLSKILHLADEEALIQPMAGLTDPIAERRYLGSPVVFTTGLIDAGDHYLVASGEADLACRMTRLGKRFLLE